jgi:hypothetical protein
VFRSSLLAIITGHVVKGFLFHNADIDPQAKTSVGPDIGRAGDESGFEGFVGTGGVRAGGARKTEPTADVSWQLLNLFNIPAAGTNGRRTYS